MTNTKAHIILVLLLAGLNISINAQQEAMYTHYMFNTLEINPAYAGSRDAMTVSGIHRSQWAGYPGAPVTQSFNIHSPLNRKELGGGLSFLRDVIGPIKQMSMQGNFVYRMELHKHRRLAFGLKAGIQHISANLAPLKIVDVNDDVALANSTNVIKPNFGAGVYYYTQRFFLGASVPAILEHKRLDNSLGLPQWTLGRQQHFYLIAGGIFKLNSYLDLKPYSFLKMTPGARIELDITPLFILYDRLTLGMSFRPGDSFGGLLGVYLNEQLELGYSYDWSYVLGKETTNTGSHEIMLRYDFIFSRKKNVRSPRNYYF